MKRSLRNLVDRIRRSGNSNPPAHQRTYQDSRARRETAAADLAWLELRARAASLVEVSAANKAIAEANSIIRRNVKAVSAAVAPAILAAHGNEAEVERILRDAIHAALERACDELERQA